MAAEDARAGSDEAPPSAELLLYLAEFGDDTGAVDDPIAVDRALAGPGDGAALKPDLPSTGGEPAPRNDPEQ